MSTLNLIFSLVAASLLFAVAGQSGSCRNKEEASGKAASAKGERLAAGVWGGEHVRLDVSEGGAAVEFDCANGSIDQPVVLDAEGRFEVKGRFAAEHGGPVRRDETDNTRPARYAGQVKGDTLTLTVNVGDSKESVGTFTLTRGSQGRLMKCR
ncbi:MAG: hypothetical protein M3348_04515 [Acidobacteriota bacterium]|nr:hypothetical protein [Acidobacteriota bacterium]